MPKQGHPPSHPARPAIPLGTGAGKRGRAARSQKPSGDQNLPPPLPVRRWQSPPRAQRDHLCGTRSSFCSTPAVTLQPSSSSSSSGGDGGVERERSSLDAACFLRAFRCRAQGANPLPPAASGVSHRNPRASGLSRPQIQRRVMEGEELQRSVGAEYTRSNTATLITITDPAG